MKRSTKLFLTYWFFALAVVIGLTIWAAGQARGAMADCIDATCRITAGDGGRGTGCVFERSGGYVHILTCVHVVENAPTVQCEFWRDGHRSQPITGRVTRRAPSADAALVVIPETAFGGVLPKVIPIAPRDYVVKQGETLTSVGCAKGAWSTGWKGHALGYVESDLCFTPTPANGRSGSAVFNADGTAIVGLLRARREVADSYGIATSLQGLYAAFGQSKKLNAQSSKLTAPTQCPGGQCPIPPRISPYRYRQDRQNQGQNQRIGRLESTWPTLPKPSTSTTIDLSPLGAKLDRIGEGQDKIAELLIEMRGKAESGKQKAEGPAAEEVKKQVAEAKEESSKLRQAVSKLIGDRKTLHARFEARIDKVKKELGEDASKREIARAYAKDLAKEKLGSGALGLTTGKLLSGALGISGPLAAAIAAGCWFVSRRIGRRVGGDESLLHRAVDRVSDKIDALKDRVHGAADVEPDLPARKAKK